MKFPLFINIPCIRRMQTITTKMCYFKMPLISQTCTTVDGENKASRRLISSTYSIMISFKLVVNLLLRLLSPNIVPFLYLLRSAFSISQCYVIQRFLGVTNPSLKFVTLVLNHSVYIYIIHIISYIRFAFFYHKNQ